MGASDRPHIEYPCEWEYRIIGIDPDRIRNLVGHVVGQLDHSLRVVRTHGKYYSMSLSLVVRSEAHRNEIYCAVRDSVHVRVII